MTSRSSFLMAVMQGGRFESRLCPLHGLKIRKDLVSAFQNFVSRSAKLTVWHSSEYKFSTPEAQRDHENVGFRSSTQLT